MLKIKHTAELGNLEAFKGALEEFLQDKQIPESRIPDIELALEELIVNVINYSYPNQKGSIELICDEKNNSLLCQIIDAGIPFDPTKSADPELDAPLSDRSNGGMGIYLAKKLVDNISYQRIDNKNILTLVINK